MEMWLPKSTLKKKLEIILKKGPYTLQLSSTEKHTPSNVNYKIDVLTFYSILHLRSAFLADCCFLRSILSRILARGIFVGIRFLAGINACSIKSTSRCN